MLLLIVAVLAISSLKQSVGNSINDLSVCIDSENNFLIVELQPPFPSNADILDVHCSSMNDSFRKSCTVQLSSKLNNTISVTVSVHGSGVHLGYVYVVQATIHTTDDSHFESDLVAIVADYIKDIYWAYSNRTRITFQCVFSNVCNSVIGGCKVELIRQVDGKSISQAAPTVEGGSVVEVPFDKLNDSELYTFTACAVSKDLMIPIGRPVSGIIPAVMISSSTFDVINPTSSALLMLSNAPVTSTSTSVTSSAVGSMSLSTIFVPTQSVLTGTDRDKTSTSGGRQRNSSDKKPHGITIGIIIAVILVVVFIGALIMISLNKIWPEGIRICNGTDQDKTTRQEHLSLEKYVSGIEEQLAMQSHRYYMEVINNEESAREYQSQIDIQSVDSYCPPARVPIDDGSIEFQIVTNEGYDDNDHV